MRTYFKSFSNLGLRYFELIDLNEYKNAGFSDGGLVRKFIFNNGKYYDSIHMSIIREEFRKNLDEN